MNNKLFNDLNKTLGKNLNSSIRDMTKLFNDAY